MAIKTIFIQLFNIFSILLYVQAELISPCPKVFVYVSRDDSTDRWYGLLNLVSEENISGVELRLTLDRSALHLENLFGPTITYDNTQFIIRNKEFSLEANSSHLIRLYVAYDSTKSVPRLVSIEQNGKLICGSVKTAAPSNVFTSVMVLPAGPLPPHCGKTSMSEPSILYGQNGIEGKWPWHAAIFKNHTGTLNYSCAGSIITTRFIVTAAHAVTDLSTGHALNPRSFLVYVGTTNLQDLPSSTQILQISIIHVHPEFLRSTFNNDIAVLQTVNPIEFTAYVKPVCLWQGNNNLQGVIGELGTVVGWRLNENNQLSDILKRIEMPIVDITRCIYSNPEFFGQHTSTFCAGFRNGSTVCNGDSGSGMVISKPDVHEDDTWYIRGLVSLGVLHKENATCNPNEFIVFTDVAKYVSWIEKIMTVSII